jgi:hypothetical protein
VLPIKESVPRADKQVKLLPVCERPAVPQTLTENQRKMKYKNSRLLISISVISATLLSGCAQFVPVKDIANDQPGYLAANFGIDSLPTSVRDKLPASGEHKLPFKVLTVLGTVSGHVGTAAIQDDFKSVLINAQDTGMVQQVYETSANGVPAGVTFSLSYLNIYSLKEETAMYSQTVAFIPFVTHDVDNNQFAFSAPQEDETYTTAFKMGTTVQIVNFRTLVWTCHASRYYPASQFNSALTGKAIDLDCESTKDGIVQSKLRRTYLTEYGIGLPRSTATAVLKMEWTYSAFDKDGQTTNVPGSQPPVEKPI